MVRMNSLKGKTDYNEQSLEILSKEAELDETLMDISELKVELQKSIKAKLLYKIYHNIIEKNNIMIFYIRRRIFVDYTENIRDIKDIKEDIVKELNRKKKFIEHAEFVEDEELSVNKQGMIIESNLEKEKEDTSTIYDIYIKIKIDPKFLDKEGSKDEIECILEENCLGKIIVEIERTSCYKKLIDAINKCQDKRKKLLSEKDTFEEKICEENRKQEEFKEVLESLIILKDKVLNEKLEKAIENLEKAIENNEFYDVKRTYNSFTLMKYYIDKLNEIKTPKYIYKNFENYCSSVIKEVASYYIDVKDKLLKKFKNNEEEAKNEILKCDEKVEKEVTELNESLAAAVNDINSCYIISISGKA